MTQQRARTCSEQAAIDPATGEAGCKRLPRHKGDHRATLHQARVAAATKRTTRGRVSKAGLKRLQIKLALAVEDGSVTPSVALSRIAAYVTRLQTRRARAASQPQTAAA
jgi:hypothetical protein